LWKLICGGRTLRRKSTKTQQALEQSKGGAIEMKDAARLCGNGQAKFCSQLSRRNCAHSLILLALLLAACPARAQGSSHRPASGLPTLTTARQAHDLSSQETRRAYPVHLAQAVVTYYDPRIGSGRAALFVHDATGSIYVELPEGAVPNLAPGVLVEVRGVTGPGEFAPIVAHPEVRVIGRSALPEDPPRMSFARLVTGAEDSHWIEAEGLVHSLAEFEHNIMLQLAMDGGSVTVVLVKEPGADYSRLVDAKVRVHANAGPTFNRSKQMIGVRLMCPNLSAITFVEAASADSFKLPVTPIDQLLRWDQINASSHRMHLRGRVTLQWPGSKLCIRDATRGICAQTAQKNHLSEGDEVDLVGFAAAENNAPVLTDALFSWKRSGTPAAAEPVTAEEALMGMHDSELVQIEGKLIGTSMEATGTTLLLTSGMNIFTATLPREMGGDKAGVWETGSKLRITGICSVQLDAQRSAIGEGMAVPVSFRILLRAPQDAAVLQRPSWWTAEHTFILLTIALAITLLVLAWVVVLRKRVEQQTKLLRESERQFRHMALHDALTGLATRLLLQDRLNVGVQIAKRRQSGLALMMLDIDHFKQINDTYGHQAGDEVLRVTAHRLVQTVRKSDTVARMGGDEFIVLLPDLIDPLVVEEIAASIVLTLALPVSFAGSGIPVSVSIGVCTAFGADLNADTLLKNADAALYQAKAHGRNCFQIYAPAMAAIPLQHTRASAPQNLPKAV
jgi:diguanylate cyclase (GGDEF)-like protein